MPVSLVRLSSIFSMGGHMLLAFDTETYLISERDKAPKPVIATWSDGVNTWYTAPDSPDLCSYFANPEVHIVGHNIAYDIAVMMRWHPHTIPLIVQAYMEGRIWDTQTRHQLAWLEQHGGEGYKQFVSLTRLEKALLNVDRTDQKKGEDIWRLKYGTLDGVPYTQWPAEALSYALEDALYTHRVFIAQGGPTGAYQTETDQVRAALCLQLVTAWGVKTNPDNIAKIATDLQGKMAAIKQELDSYSVEIDGKSYPIVGTGSEKATQHLVEQGWRLYIQQKVTELQQRHNVTIDWSLVTNMRDGFDLGHWLAVNSKTVSTCGVNFCYDHKQWNPPVFIADLKHAVPPLPRSTKGFKTGENDLEPILEFVPILKRRAEYKHLNKMYGTYIEPYQGRDTIHANYSALVSTGRTASDNPNLQNIPRTGGFRDNLWAREGYLLGTVDYAALEMVTLAATLVDRQYHNAPKESRTYPPLAKAINDGVDLHCMTASHLFGESYEVFVQKVAEEKKAKKADPHAPTPYSERRQGSKALNFGASGGLGPTAFQPYAKHTYGVEWTLEQCRKYIRDWKKSWPDINRYLKENGDEIEQNAADRKAQAVNALGRRKNNCIYTQLCNYPFQSLAADGAKIALWQLTLHQLLGWFWTNAEQHWVGAMQYLGERAQAQINQYRGSPMRESHVVNFVHDEVAQEHPEHLAEAAFALQQEIMRTAMASVTNGVRVEVEGQLGKRWAH